MVSFNILNELRTRKEKKLIRYFSISSTARDADNNTVVFN